MVVSIEISELSNYQQANMNFILLYFKKLLFQDLRN